jgi:L-rhamnose mutarotase
VGDFVDPPKKGDTMRFFGRTINLKDDSKAIESYKEYHRKVWPEVEHQVGKSGVTKMRIFLFSRRLFMYIETADDFDPEAFVAEWMQNPKCVAWEEIMQQYQEPLPEAKPGEWWTTMEPVYQYGAT